MKTLLMNNFALTIAMLFSATFSIAQGHKGFFNLNRYSTNEFPRLYANGGLIPFNSFTKSNNIPDLGKVGFNIEYHSYGLQFERRSLNGNAKELPKDYILAESYFFGPSIPSDRLIERTITAKKIFYTKSKFVQFVAQGGVAFIDISQATNFQSQPRSSSSGSFLELQGSNYNYIQKKRSFNGLHFKAGIDFPLSPVIGVSTRAFATLTNNNFNYYGVEFDLNFGYIRRFEGFHKK